MQKDENENDIFTCYDEEDDDYENPIGELQEFLTKSQCAPPIYKFTEEG